MSESQELSETSDQVSQYAAPSAAAEQVDDVDIAQISSEPDNNNDNNNDDDDDDDDDVDDQNGDTAEQLTPKAPTVYRSIEDDGTEEGSELGSIDVSSTDGLPRRAGSPAGSMASDARLTPSVIVRRSTANIEHGVRTDLVYDRVHKFLHPEAVFYHQSPLASTLIAQRLPFDLSIADSSPDSPHHLVY